MSNKNLVLVINEFAQFRDLVESIVERLNHEGVISSDVWPEVPTGHIARVEDELKEGRRKPDLVFLDDCINIGYDQDTNAEHYARIFKEICPRAKLVLTTRGHFADTQRSIKDYNEWYKQLGYCDSVRIGAIFGNIFNQEESRIEALIRGHLS